MGSQKLALHNKKNWSPLRKLKFFDGKEKNLENNFSSELEKFDINKTKKIK
tara:strand:+ start:186 stop:338 length:153 start_codon:yes stop_codon:yes gene_type:complete